MEKNTNKPKNNQTSRSGAGTWVCGEKKLTLSGSVGQLTSSWDSLGLVMGLGYFQVLPTPFEFPQPCDYGVASGLPWCLKTQEPHCELGLWWALRSMLVSLPRPVSVCPSSLSQSQPSLGLPLRIWSSLPPQTLSLTAKFTPKQFGIATVVRTSFCLLGFWFLLHLQRKSRPHLL